jgi:hypothetical protein
MENSGQALDRGPGAKSARPDDGQQTATCRRPPTLSLKTPWVRALLIWGSIGILLLFFGGVAAQGYLRLMAPCTPACLDAEIPWLGLVLLSIGGGVALGLIGVALALSTSRGAGWGLGFVVVGGVLFLIFVWPTPFKYYRAKDGQLIRVHRVTGGAVYVPEARRP